MMRKSADFFFARVATKIVCSKSVAACVRVICATEIECSFLPLDLIKEQ